MEKEPQIPPQPADAGDEEQPPPFDPDPRLVTFLERGADNDAEERFRVEIEQRRSGARDGSGNRQPTHEDGSDGQA